MYCTIRHIECYLPYCDGSCYNPPGTIQFNYECPNCKGKFNYPYQKSNETSNYQIINICPFCGNEMKGMN